MPRKNNGPYLDTNESGYHEIRWTEKGRSKRASTGTKNLGEAQQVFAEFLKGQRDLSSGKFPVTMIVDAYLNGHGATVAAPGRIADSMKAIKAHFGDQCVTTITPDDCDTYARLRRAGKIGEKGRKVVDTTINYELSMLSVAINDAINNKRLPAALKPRITRPRPAGPREDWITHEQYKELIPHIPVLTKETKRTPARFTRIYRFLVIAFNTAQRRRAIECLEWDRVNFQTGLIDFRPKGARITNKRKSVVPMSKELRAVLEQAYEERTGSYVLDIPGSIRKTFDNTMEKAGMGWITRHTIRRTWATWAAMRAVSLYDIADVLGDDIRTVEKHYRKYQPAHLRGAVEGSAPELGEAGQNRA